MCPVLWLSTLQPVYHDRRTGAIHDPPRPTKNTYHRSASPVLQKYTKIKLHLFQRRGSGESLFRSNGDVNVKVKLALEQATKTLMGSRDIALLFL
jgi:hypothetical protein